MNFQVTARYGRSTQRYHTFQVEAPGAVPALRLAADRIPEEIGPEVDLVELRVAPDPDKERHPL
jgi:hypothetical protein